MFVYQFSATALCLPFTSFYDALNSDNEHNSTNKSTNKKKHKDGVCIEKIFHMKLCTPPVKNLRLYSVTLQG